MLSVGVSCGSESKCICMTCWSLCDWDTQASSWNRSVDDGGGGESGVVQQLEKRLSKKAWVGRRSALYTKGDEAIILLIFNIFWGFICEWCDVNDAVRKKEWGGGWWWCKHSIYLYLYLRTKSYTDKVVCECVLKRNVSQYGPLGNLQLFWGHTEDSCLVASVKLWTPNIYIQIHAHKRYCIHFDNILILMLYPHRV